MLIDFNGMSTHLGVIAGLEIRESHSLCSYLHFLCNSFFFFFAQSYQINFFFKQIYLIHRYTNLSKPGSNGNEGEIYTSQRSKTGASPTDAV